MISKKRQACQPLAALSNVMPSLWIMLTSTSLFVAWLSSATTISQQVTFETANQSMWGTGASTQVQETIFLGTEWNTGDTTLFQIGNASSGSNGVRVAGQSSGRFGIETDFAMDSGTVNTSLPIEYTITLPSVTDLVDGAIVSMGVTGASLAAGAMLETLSPMIQMQSNLILEANAAIQAKGCYDILVSSGCADSGWHNLPDFELSPELLSINQDPDTGLPDGEVRFLDGFKEIIAIIDTTAEVNKRTKKIEVNDPDNPGQKKEKKKFDVSRIFSIGNTPILETDLHIPIITENTTSTESLDLMNNSSGILQTSGEDEFLDISIDMDQIVTQLANSPPLGVTAGLEFGKGSVSVTADLLDVTFSPDIALTQDFELSIDDIRVSYAFGNEIEVGFQDGQLSTQNSLNDLSVGQLIDFRWTGDDISITPSYEVDLSLTNHTGLRINTSLSLDLLKGNISYDMFGVFDDSLDFGPLKQLVVGGPSFDPPPIFNESFALGGVNSEIGRAILLTKATAAWEEGYKGNWNEGSKWGTGGSPNGNDVVIRSPNAFVGSQSQVTIKNETASSGSLSLLGNSLLRIGVDETNAGILNINSNRIHNEGEINLNNGQMVFNQLTNIRGDGSIYLNNNNSWLTSAADAKQTLNLHGQEIVVETTEQRFINQDNPSGIKNLNVNLHEGSSLSVNNNILSLQSTILTGMPHTNHVITGSGLHRLVLTDADIRNVDLHATVIISDISNTTHNSNYWRTGEDNFAKNLGDIYILNDDKLDKKVLYLSGPDDESNTFDNIGTITVKGGSAGQSVLATYSSTGATFSLMGNGKVNLESDTAFLRSYNNQDSLVNGAEHTIQGFGTIENFSGITHNLTNNGAIWANEFNKTLKFSHVDLINNGIIGADNSGILALYDPISDSNKLTNYGSVVARNSGVVVIDGDNLTNLTAIGNLVRLNGGNWVADNGDLNIIKNGSYTRFFNEAHISLSGSNAGLTFNGSSLSEFEQFQNTTLGRVTIGENIFFNSEYFSNHGTLSMRGGSINGVFNGSQGLIEGFGSIAGICGDTCVDVNFTNNGTIRAVNGTLTLVDHLNRDARFINYGRVEVMGGAELVLENFTLSGIFTGSPVFSGDGGTWAAYGKSAEANIIMSTPNITGVIVEPLCIIPNFCDISFIDDFSAGVKTLDNGNLVLHGQFANFYTAPALGGKINLQTSLDTINANASLQLENGQIFTAANNVANNGKLFLADGEYQSAAMKNFGEIAGYGNLTVANLTNKGNIVAKEGKLSLAGTVTNHSGIISVGDTVNGQTSQGVLGGSFTVNGGQVKVGMGSILASDQYGVLNNVEVHNQGSIIARSGNLTLDTAGNSINTGIIQASVGGALIMQNGTFDNTSGKILADNSAITLKNFEIVNGAVQIIGQNAVLQGYGNLTNVALKVSNGLITANVNGQKLTIEPSSAAELFRATLQAENGGTLFITNGDFNARGGTLIKALDGSTVEILNVAIQGGKLVTQGSGKIVDLGSSNFTDMTFDAVTEVASGGEFNLFGTSINKQSLTALQGGVMHLHNARLTGLGATLSSDGTFIESVYNGLVRVNLGGQLVLDGGTIDNQGVENLGTIEVIGGNPSQIDVTGDTFINQGKLQVTTGAELVVQDSELSNHANVKIDKDGLLTVDGIFSQSSGSTKVNGTLSAGTLIFYSGTLNGSGVITGDTQILQSASINPGNSPDTLTIDGDLDLFGSLVIEVESRDIFDMLNVLGDVSFSADTLFDFRLGAGFNPFDLFTLDFLVADSFIGSHLLSKSNFMFTGLASGFDFDLNFSNNNDLFSLIFLDHRQASDVNEPTTLYLFMLVVILLVRRRFTHKVCH